MVTAGGEIGVIGHLTDVRVVSVEIGENVSVVATDWYQDTNRVGYLCLLVSWSLKYHGIYEAVID